MVRRFLIQVRAVKLFEIQQNTSFIKTYFISIAKLTILGTIHIT